MRSTSWWEELWVLFSEPSGSGKVEAAGAVACATLVGAAGEASEALAGSTASRIAAQIPWRRTQVFAHPDEVFVFEAGSAILIADGLSLWLEPVVLSGS